MDLLEVINECLKEDDDQTDMSDIGFKLFMAAKTYRRKAEKQGDVGELTDEEVKIRNLRGAEKEGNLAWMNYSSWYRLPLPFREAFLSQIDPLIWSGVYFRNSDFEHSKDILGNLGNDCSLAVIKDSKNLRYVSVTAISREFDSMSEKKFSRYCRDFRTRLVRVYGQDSSYTPEMGT